MTYKREPYALVRSDRDRARFVYHFRKGGERFPVLDPALEKVRNRSSDLSYVLAPLWGFLPHDLQRRLEYYGRYKPRPYVIMSICFNVLLAIALIGPGLKDVSLGVFKIGSLVSLAAAIALLLESIVRLIRLMTDRRATGSFLGFLFKPVYDLAIKDRPVPPS